ncbi:MAG TPA: DUF4328 domain-containing protein [Acidimicrobiales bacterium]|jgi:hypothetical protein|nr:DUF4328 domain-containing protein [Acidimicrobiales bacterium]
MATDIPAGWYPDPAGTSGLRWWDGGGWTERISPAAQVIAPPDIADEARRASRARVALLVAVPAQLGGLAIFRLRLRHFFDQINLDVRAGSPTPRLSAGGWAISSQLSAAVGVLAGVLFLLWFARSAANAESLGLPARREPAAGVAGFVIPIINLWWPYQSTSDLFPPGDGHQPVVLRWFLLWMVGGLAGGALCLISSFIDGWAGWLLLSAPAVLTTLAAMAARQVVAEAVAVHTALARR